jgi:hypothetical protein
MSHARTHTHTHTHTRHRINTHTWWCLITYQWIFPAAGRHSRHYYGLSQYHIWSHHGRHRHAQLHISNTTTLSVALLSFSFRRHIDRDILGHDAVLIKWFMEIRVTLKRTVPHLTEVFTAQWILHIPHAVQKTTFRPHGVFKCFLQLLLETAIIYLNIKRVAFLMDKNCVLCEVGPVCYTVINCRVSTANSRMAITKTFSVDNWSNPNHYC